MKAKDLRIGNWLIPFTENGFELEPRQIKASEFFLLSQNPDKAKPIKLTEEWLIKFGFVRSIRLDCEGYKRTNVWSNYSFSITIWDDGRFFYDWIGGNIEVKFVHQLQNLYYSLTGEELKFKE